MDGTLQARKRQRVVRGRSRARGKDGIEVLRCLCHGEEKQRLQPVRPGANDQQLPSWRK
jgi:hypothetical protein